MSFRTVPALLSATLTCLLASGPAPSTAGTFDFSIVALGSDTQSWPTINFEGPYFYYLLTNEAAVADSFDLAIENLTEPGWFPQVCLRQICYPVSARIRLEATTADSVGVNIVPFFDGFAEADFRVTSVGDPSQSVLFHVRLYAGTSAVGVGSVPVAATQIQLSPSYPNPVRESARIGFVLPQRDHVSLRLYDVMGRQVATLVDGSLPSGAHSVEWDGTLAGGRTASSGTYFYRLETPRGSLSRRLVLLR